jgi:hypothetical protein
MKLPVKAVRLVNHPDTPALQGVVTTPVPKRPMVERSYQYLVTMHGVPPEKAKQLLVRPIK